MNLEQLNASMLLVLLNYCEFVTDLVSKRRKLTATDLDCLKIISWSHDTEEKSEVQQEMRAYPAVATSGVGLDVSIVVTPRCR